jgi:2-dehydro-3-deoxyphosphogluconate aldolase/(4S)-4-hydroxy-2-oxoglutarate aldolase
MPPGELVNIATALYQGGVRILEVTLNSPGALPAISDLNKVFKNRLLIGAGTVLDAKDARDAISAGATFLISPTTDPEVIRIAKDAGVVSIPGAYTPTEILAAYKLGADIVKVFPAPDAAYIKNIRGPLDKIMLMPTGGIHAGNIKAFAEAGSVAFGIGSSLVNSKAVINENYYLELTASAQRLIAALNH